MSFSRRQLLTRLGALGGSGAVYTAMSALGLNGALASSATANAASVPAVAPGKGARVVVLGAGIAGLTAAYELERADYRVTVLEARGRVGGRNWTIRGGDKVEMIGEADQTCTFDEGQYFNAGPARIPSHHVNLLGYCRRLGVPLEVEVNSSRGAYVLGSKGAPVRMRQAINDTRGWLSELLSKAVSQGALDQSISAADREKLLPFLRMYGDLSDDAVYKGSARSGLVRYPGAADAFAEHGPAMPLSELLANEQLDLTLFEDALDMQATMFQPVGGMDQIPRGYERAIQSPILKGAKVTRIGQSPTGVTIAYTDGARGAARTIEADHVIVTLPLPVLASIPADFSAPVKTAIASVPYDHSNKIAFQSPRFWEDEMIYGGLSFVGGETQLVWYPSWGMHTPTGVLVATYGSGPPAKTFAARPMAEQTAMARAVVARLHPGQEGKLARPIVVNWSKIPHNLGPWPDWDAVGAAYERNDVPAYRLLNQPDGRAFFCGAHLSQTPGWQEGAVLSAHRTLGQLSAKLAA